MAKVKRALFDAGWMRWGWPERVGGLGGSNLLRAYLGEAVARRDLWEPGFSSLHEVLAPTMIDYASPEVAATMVPRLLRGDEMWCQGFSEPGTGSNLASLSCRAVRDDDGWRVTGQKVWTSLAQFSQRCVLLTRTGTRGVAPPGDHCPLRRHGSGGDHGSSDRGDARPRGVLRGLLRRRARTVRPHAGHRGSGLGRGDGHPALRAQLGVVASRRIPPPPTRAAVGDRAGRLARPGRGRRGGPAHSRHSGLARGRPSIGLRRAGTLGAETSIDKVLLATAEQAVFDLAESGLAKEIALDDDPISARWRSEFLYSRSATIYGGSAEIQRNIIARRLLDLGNDR